MAKETFPKVLYLKRSLKKNWGLIKGGYSPPMVSGSNTLRLAKIGKEGPLKKGIYSIRPPLGFKGSPPQKKAFFGIN